MVDTDRLAPDTDTRPQAESGEARHPARRTDRHMGAGERTREPGTPSVALADEPAAARQFSPQQARRMVVLDLSRAVHCFLVRGIHRQRPAADRLVQGRAPVPRLPRLSGGQIWRVPGARGFSRSLYRRRDQGAWMDDLAADPLRQLDHHPQPADPAADPADMDADRRPVPRRAREAKRQGRRDRSPALQQARTALAWLRSGRARHRRPPHLRLSHLDSCSGSRSPASRR